jgi:hypothetical protein
MFAVMHSKTHSKKEQKRFKVKKTLLKDGQKSEILAERG